MEPEPGAGAGFEICLEPEPENQKRTGSGNAAFFTTTGYTTGCGAGAKALFGQVGARAGSLSQTYGSG